MQDQFVSGLAKIENAILRFSSMIFDLCSVFFLFFIIYAFHSVHLCSLFDF